MSPRDGCGGIEGPEPNSTERSVLEAVAAALMEGGHPPLSSVSSSRDIAEQVGNVKAVRAVGGANGRNPLPIVVPCHRVIGSNGKLTGFGGGLETKEFLLSLEAGRSGLFGRDA